MSSASTQSREGVASVALKPLAESDLPLTMQWRNDERSLRWFKDAAPLQWESHLAWFRRQGPRTSRDRMFMAWTSDGVPVGQSSIYNFDMGGNRAEVGRFLSDPELRGRGLFREALLQTLDMAFNEMGLDEVHLEVISGNTRAIRLYESVGFTVIGTAAAIKDDGLTAMHLARGDHRAVT